MLALRRRRRPDEPETVDDLGGLAFGAAPVLLAEREAGEIEEGALDPDEAGDPAWWDEGADDEG